MKLRKKGKNTDSEWFGVEHYYCVNSVDLFKDINVERLQVLYPEIFKKSKPKLVKKHTK